LRAKRIALLSTLEDQISTRFFRSKFKEYQARIKNFESDVRELESSNDFAESPFSKVKSKLCEGRVQEAMQEELKSKHGVEQKCAEDESKLRPVLTLIEEKNEKGSKITTHSTSI